MGQEGSTREIPVGGRQSSVIYVLSAPPPGTLLSARGSSLLESLGSPTRPVQAKVGECDCESRKMCGCSGWGEQGAMVQLARSKKHEPMRCARGSAIRRDAGCGTFFCWGHSDSDSDSAQVQWGGVLTLVHPGPKIPRGPPVLRLRLRWLTSNSIHGAGDAAHAQVRVRGHDTTQSLQLQVQVQLSDNRGGRRVGPTDAPWAHGEP